MMLGVALALTCVLLGVQSVPILEDCSVCQHWELVSNLTIDGSLPVAKYRSRRTGLTVAIGNAESPIVNGYFCLATEAFTDDGLPHTLEHLIFLGRYVLCASYSQARRFAVFKAL